MEAAASGVTRGSSSSTLAQWFLRITTYAVRLLRNLDHLDWSESVKFAQRA
jgi:leucyl-tRNA synthetase